MPSTNAATSCYPAYERTYESLRSLLQEADVSHLRPDDLDDEQRAFLRNYVDANVLPFLSPQIVNARHPFPHLENGALYLVVRLDEEADAAGGTDASAGAAGGAKSKGKASKGGKDAPDAKADKDKGKAEKAATKQTKTAKNLGAEGVTLGLVPLPRQCERVIELPGRGLQFILLEHAIEMVAPEIFSMYTVKHTNVICVTRNADLDATEGSDEADEDYREHMKRILKKRSRLAPVRLESERKLSNTVGPLLMKRLNLKEHQTFVTSVPLDMSYTYALAARLPEKKRAALVNAPFTPQWPACLDRKRPVIDQVSEREVLLSYPYESMDPFVQLLREAAHDPSVISIKITLYRLARQSHMAEALIAAAEAGKEVTALFELRARFDESNNIEWSQRFEQAGCKVIYGFRDYKVHSKICCITRQTDHGLQHITQLGTGNYNEKTARLYTDLSFITADPTIGRDAVEFFRNMGLENTSDNYDILWVAPLQIKPQILEHIDEQMALARAGRPCGLFFKTNSVTDKDVIEKLAEASQAGVPVTLLVRGISCIVPGVEGCTEGVRVVSIVGRLLEHSRIYGFGPREDMKVYLSSADLMTRNMDKRIEIAWPVLSDDLRAQVLGYLDTCMDDTAKLRELRSNRRYTPLGFFAKEDERRPDGAVRFAAVPDRGGAAPAFGRSGERGRPRREPQAHGRRRGGRGRDAAGGSPADGNGRGRGGGAGRADRAGGHAGRRGRPCGGFRACERAHEHPGQRASGETRRQAEPARARARPHPALLAPPSPTRAPGLPRAAPPACRRRFVRTAGRDRALRRARANTSNTTRRPASGWASSHARTVRTASGAASSCGKPKTPVLMQQNATERASQATAASRQLS